MKLISYLLMAMMVFTSTACLNQEEGQTIPGVKGPKVNIQDGKILITVELTNVELDGGMTLPIPDMDYSTVTVSPAVNEDGSGSGTLIRVTFDLKDVESDKFKLVDPQALPDGRPFPFLINGTLPALAFQLPKIADSTFYASNKVFGFFIPIELPDNFNYSIHYRIKINGKNYGVVSLIHPDANGIGAGVVALLTLDDIRNNPDAQKILRISKRNKSAVY